MSNADVLHFIITGGTIDSDFDPINGTIKPSKQTFVPEFIASLQLYGDVQFNNVCMKDSRDLTDQDREKILEAIIKTSGSRIVVTHGSYTVVNTAQYIKKTAMELNKVVIFVCSLIPLKGFSPTDAGFNLGYAVAKTQDLDPGIYVCMNGKVFTPENVTKILSSGRFASIYTK